MKIRTPEIERQFLQELKDGANVHAASKKIGVSRSTVYAWREDSPSFAEPWDTAFAEGAVKREAGKPNGEPVKDSSPEVTRPTSGKSKQDTNKPDDTTEPVSFRFSGDPNPHHDDRAQQLESYGQMFYRDSYAEVSDPFVIGKLRGSTHFQEEGVPLPVFVRKEVSNGQAI